MVKVNEYLNLTIYINQRLRSIIFECENFLYEELRPELRLYEIIKVLRNNHLVIGKVSEHKGPLQTSSDI